MPATRPGRRCARLVLTLLRDGRTVPDGWDHAERQAVTRLHSWAYRHLPLAPPVPAEPVARVEVTEDEHGIAVDGALLDGPIPPRVGPGAVLFVVGPDREYRVTGLGTNADGTGELLLGPADEPAPTYGLRVVRPPTVDLDGPATPTCDAEGHDHSTSACLGPSTAGDPPSPLPSEVLRSVDAGRGVAGWVLTPEALDHLPILSRDSGDGNGDRLDGEPLPEAAEQVRRFLGVPRDKVREVTHDPCEAQADALRAEVARLTVLLDDAEREADRADAATHRATVAEADLARHRAERDDARAQLVEAQQHLDRLLRPRGDDDGRTLASSVIVEGMRHLPEAPVELDVRGPGLVTFDGRELRVTYHPAQAITDPRATPPPPLPALPGPLADDPRRPHLAHFPDDAVVLTYRELRRLVALHLDHADTSPALPATLARAMRDDGAPLRLAEVLDQ